MTSSGKYESQLKCKPSLQSMTHLQRLRNPHVSILLYCIFSYHVSFLGRKNKLYVSSYHHLSSKTFPLYHKNWVD